MGFAGNINADVLLVGESPGRQEEIDKKPFKGRSGMLLMLTMTKVGLYRDEVFLANAAMCKLDKGVLSTKQMNEILKCCRSNVALAINEIKPKVVVALGDVAIRQLVKLSGGVKKRHGTFVWSDEFGCFVFCTYHPAFCLRQPSYTPVFESDFVKLRRFIDNDYKHIDGGVEIIEVSDLVDMLPLQTSAMAIDTETQGLDPLSPNSFIISFSFCMDTNKAYQVYLHELGTEEDHDFIVDWSSRSGKKLTEKKIYVKRSPNFRDNLQGLICILANESIKKYMFNGIFDLRFIYEAYRREYGYTVPHENFAMDVQSAAHLLDENIYSKASLESVQKTFSTLDSQYSQEFDKTHDKSNMIEVPHGELTKYAALDAYTTYVCALEARAQIITKPKLTTYFANFVMPTLSRSLFTLTSNGCLVDVEAIPRVKEQIASIVTQHHAEAIAGIPKAVAEQHEDNLRLTRTALIRDVLYSKEGFKLEAKTLTDKGTPSVGAKARSAIPTYKMSKKCANFISHYEQWSEAQKLLTTYVKSFESSIKSDGKIHPIYSAVTTVTGRTSTVGPSLNLPKRGSLGSIIRTLIKAPEGYMLVGVDASQAELRWMAQLSGDETMRGVYEIGGDIHDKTTLAILKKPRSEISDEDFKTARTASKSLNFGLLYGMSAGGYMKYAKMEYGVELSFDEATHYRNTFFSTYPGITRYHKDVIKFAHKHGYVVSPFGRVRRLPEIHSLDETTMRRNDRQALNHAIQSASSDTVLVALNEMLKDNVLNPTEICPVMFVHDELVFEVLEDKVDDYIKLIINYMENPPLEKLFNYKMVVPLVAEAKVGRNYGEMHDYAVKA